MICTCIWLSTKQSLMYKNMVDLQKPTCQGLCVNRGKTLSLKSDCYKGFLNMVHAVGQDITIVSKPLLDKQYGYISLSFILWKRICLLTLVIAVN